MTIISPCTSDLLLKNMNINGVMHLSVNRSMVKGGPFSFIFKEIKKNKWFS